ncbi:hypothetical protein JAO76_02375 [Pontibacter sp. BT310]|uniref:GyrI-like small molecule binding domain-containing protein n=1 Tax=Pontibacter populi TaxID=890055 RepID=A0ABS6X7J7_9BACT|nr:MULTISPECIES: hypothetical protein [Pontibacter]MBJ6117019.1 hypothetical protein [Pontibacter sp. BT310]MBR0569443.1 hypothetical protein [Microvirga sp. STS03]MBW3363872.1 hypothetical protein [Pontibacter populi]
MKLKHILILAAIVLVGWFIYDSFSLPSVDDLEGDFKEVAFYRNENNTGPIVRVYAVTVADTLWQQMRQYGEFMPHTKYGNTKVYFFLEGSPVPDKVVAGDQSFEAQYQEFAVAKYEKESMGQVSFVQYPFR